MQHTTCRYVHIFLFVSTFETYPPVLSNPSVLYIHLPTLLSSTTLLLPINRSICSSTPIPTSRPSSHPSFLSPLVPTPLFLPFPFFFLPSIPPVWIMQQPRSCTAIVLHFNVNVVSLSQLLGHYHPSRLIIVIQIPRQTMHITENKGTRM